jgi:tRNA-(ms[2]io[6]A)-hydroxylase
MSSRHDAIQHYPCFYHQHLWPHVEEPTPSLPAASMTGFIVEPVDLTAIHTFLPCPTPLAWVGWALDNPTLLLIDHAHCEKKAAATALNLMFRYTEQVELQQKLAQLAREELLHFEQVLGILQQRQITYRFLTPSRYAAGLRENMRLGGTDKLVDTLIISAFIEARSCERFFALSQKVDAELARYYRYLLKSEARHFEDYLALAQIYAEAPIDERVAFFRKKEKHLIEAPDTEFRFHSGIPAANRIEEIHEFAK